MQIMPYIKCHGHQSFRRALSSSSVRQLCWRNWRKNNVSENLYFCHLDNVSGRIECKLGPISNLISSTLYGCELWHVMSSSDIQNVANFLFFRQFRQLYWQVDELTNWTKLFWMTDGHETWNRAKFALNTSRYLSKGKK